MDNERHIEEVIGGIQVAINDVRNAATLAVQRVDSVEIRAPDTTQVSDMVEGIVNKKVEEYMERFASLVLEGICEKFGDAITIQSLASFAQNYNAGR